MGQLETKLRNQGLTDAEIKERFKAAVVNHIQQVVGHFKGVITEWSVLNEWRGLDRDLPDVYANIFQNDTEFIRLVFQTARTSDPAARLFLNDNDINTKSNYGYSRTLAIVQDLKKLGLIDAVGLQMTDANVFQPPDKQQVTEAMKSWGIPVIVSSATFSTEGMTGTLTEIEHQQALVGLDMLDACIQSQVCNDFRFWDGYGDEFSFKGAEARATLFDEDMKPKEIYFSIKAYLTQVIDSQSN
jgi:endo-1,4-beta-xylanase